MEVPSAHWTKYVPQKYQDRVPRTITLADGSAAIVVEGLQPRTNANDMYGGKGRDVWTPWGNNHENTPGTSGPEERLKCLDIDGMDAEVIFHSVVHGPRTWRSIRDDDVYNACVRAYNDFIAKEYAAYAPDRFFPMGVIPISDLQSSIEEMHYCAELGLKGITLLSFPSGRGFPSSEDDAFWAEALKIKMPVTIHVDLDRTGPRDGPLIKYPKTAPGQDIASSMVRFARAGGINALQLIMGGVFDRFPDLRVFFVENQLGWVPLYMTVMDERYDRHIWWAKEHLGFQPLEMKPSDYVRRNCLWGFQHDPAGVELRQWYGPDNAIWGSDFPHQESEYPHSKEVLENNFKGVREQDKWKMIRDNAIDFFHLN
jgi:predicted TIM-barrel fold metal-dependent hydrolase